MARVLSSNIVMRSPHNPGRANAPGSDTHEPSALAEISRSLRLPDDSPITRAFMALWGPQVEVLDLPAPQGLQGGLRR